jgi:hypothetical protein
MHPISTGAYRESPMNSRRFDLSVDAQALIFAIFALASPLPTQLTIRTVGKR